MKEVQPLGSLREVGTLCNQQRFALKFAEKFAPRGDHILSSVSLSFSFVKITFGSSRKSSVRTAH